MNNKIPPPIIGVAVALLILLLNQFFSVAQLESELLKFVGIVLVVVGLIVELYSVSLFFKAKTTVNPLKPINSKSLVVDGFYRISRNPMYAGMLLMLVGLVVWTGNIATAPVLAVFVLYINRFQIQPEEQALEQLFGDEYLDYKARVRRWI